MSARILVVDDVDVNVRLLEAKLTVEYYDALTCNDGVTALALAAEHRTRQRSMSRRPVPKGLPGRDAGRAP